MGIPGNLFYICFINQLIDIKMKSLAIKHQTALTAAFVIGYFAIITVLSFILVN